MAVTNETLSILQPSPPPPRSKVLHKNIASFQNLGANDSANNHTDMSIKPGVWDTRSAIVVAF
jgi:hypothetical protein